MKLSKLYSNHENLFSSIDFHDGLNVVFAEIRNPKNRDKDTHNLGKSTLGRLIDFMFLSKKNTDFFLFKHFEIFQTFIFFLEIEVDVGSYITIRRDVAHSSKICFKKHKDYFQNYSDLPQEQWDHCDVPFDRAKELLDGLLNFTSIPYPWNFRNALGYFIRSQDDFSDVFRLNKFRSKDSDWKPFLAFLLGFDYSLISNHYKNEKLLAEKKHTENVLKAELGNSVENISKVEGILLLKQKDAEKKQALLDSFNFGEIDKDKSLLSSDKIEEEIAELNQKRYALQISRKKIIKTLNEEKMLFSTEDAQALFKEVGILFADQIKNDFEKLVSFNKAITEERTSYLIEEKKNIDTKLILINKELDILNKSLSSAMEYLSDTQTFKKYKTISNELIVIKADISALERQRERIQKLQEIRSEIRTLTEERNRLRSLIEDDCEKTNSDQKSLFSIIRLYFSEIIDTVVNRKALLSVSTNKDGHLQFKAEILDESGNATSADMGHTYRKLLCIAFDLSILRAYQTERFPHFVFHDGVFESLDNRKKENLLTILRDYTSIGIQSTITLIDSDLPHREKTEPTVFDDTEIVLKLHDENQNGRLFKMNAW